MVSSKSFSACINTCMKIAEVTKTKPITPQQAQIDALTKQKEVVSNNLKTAKGKQKIAKAQQQIRDASQAISTSS